MPKKVDSARMGQVPFFGLFPRKKNNKMRHGTSMNLDTPAVSGEYVRVFIRLFKSLGYPPQLLRKILGKPEDQFTATETLLSTQELLGIIERGFRIIDMPYVGLALGNHMTLATHGMAGIAAMTQPSYADALKLASRACDSIFPALHMELVENTHEISLVVTEQMPLQPYVQFFIELIFVNFNNIMHFLIGDNAEPTRLCFSYPEPAYGHIYRRYFRCPLRFNAPQSAFVVQRSVAARPLIMASQRIAEQAEVQFSCEFPTTMMTLLPNQLRNLLVQSFGAFPSLEKAARNLGMSGRTLRRQLHLAGTSYQNELDEVRKEFSLSYMLRNDISITDIAISLGFNDSSAFSRAFKKWTGESPRDYRRKILECQKNAKNIFSMEKQFDDFLSL